MLVFKIESFILNKHNRMPITKNTIDKGNNTSNAIGSVSFHGNISKK
ncbi:hypothetical protein [Clostridium cellulovorans]|nr:hypothetical protein [Clostridium cellulovorans]